MKTILVPVDGSEHSVRALEKAMSMFSEEAGSKLHVITVQAPIVSGNVTRYFSAQDIKAFYEEEGRKALAPVKHLIERAGDTCTEKVLVGPIAATIAEYAKEHACDQIIMGTRGLGRVSGLVLGSIATKVISLSSVPVTLVK